MSSRLLPAVPALHSPVQCSADLVPWRLSGERLTVVAKVSFFLQSGEPKLAPPEPLVEKETASRPTDLIPLLPNAELLVTGHAFAARGREATALKAGFRLMRGPSVVTQKLLDVVATTPFQKMPITWERALRTALNPGGVDTRSGTPNWVDSQRASNAAGFGPIPMSFPDRLARLGNHSPPVLSQEPMELWSPFDFTFFHAAPQDQRFPRIFGDEILTLIGLHPDAESIDIQLPRVAVAARLYDGTNHVTRNLDLLPDRLVIDTDRQLGTLTYRAGIAFASSNGQRIELGMSVSGAEAQFADSKDPATKAGRYHHPVFQTAALDPNALRAASLPFADALLGRPARKAPTAKAPGVPSGVPFVSSDDRESTAPPEPIRPASEARHATLGLDAATLRAQATEFLKAAQARSSPRAIDESRPSPELFDQPPQSIEEPTIPLPRKVVNTTERLDPSQLKVEPSLPFNPTGERPPVRAASLEGLPFADLRRIFVEDTISGPDEPDVSVQKARPSEVVPIVTDAPLSVASYAWQINPPDDVLIVVVKASFDLVRDGIAALREEPDLLSGDVFVDDDLERALDSASDFAILKPEVDVLVRGHVYAPVLDDGRRAATVMQAAVRMRGEEQTLDHSIAVFGDRTWGTSLPSEPEPFEMLPLRYDRSFGGPDFGPNQVGLGYKGKRLPNFESLANLIKSPSDSPTPVCLGALHPQASSRWGLVGTYNRAWLKSRWPYFAEDFDYRFFQSAHPAQRMKTVVGDERYELVGLHPSHSVFRGKLGGAKARAFVAVSKRAGGGFVEVPLRIDTVTLVPDDNAVHVVWRGFIKVSDDDAPEAEHIFATIQPAGSKPMTVHDARARYLALLEPPKEEPRPVLPPAPPEEAEDDAATEQAIRDALERIAAYEREVAKTSPPVDSPPPPLPKVTPAELAAALRATGTPEDDIEKIVTIVKPRPTEPPEPGPVDLRAMVLDRVSRNESLAGLNLREADLSDLDLHGQDLAGADLTKAVLDRANLSEANLRETKLASASLVAANLEKTTLSNADLTGARVTSARFLGANLDGVEARSLRARAADFTGARLARAKLNEARLPDAQFVGAVMPDVDLTQANLRGASFVDCAMQRARLYEVRGDNAKLDRADLTNARAEAASFPGASFRGVVANEAILERADVSKASFVGATLKSASFHRANCHGTAFDGADLREARMNRGDFRNGTFVKANLMDAKCDRAILERTDFRRSNLHAASLNRALLRNASLDEAIVTRSQLDGGPR